MADMKNQPTNTDKNRQAKKAEGALSSVKKEISKIYYNWFEKQHQLFF
jgi:hypothetical protein